MPAALAIASPSSPAVAAAPEHDERRFPEVPPGMHEVLGGEEANGTALLLGWLAGSAQGEVAWIGDAVWPAAASLVKAGLWRRSLFVAVEQARSRAWAAELAMRCAAVCAVVVDGRGFDMTMTRRLQLAAGHARDRDARLFLLRTAAASGGTSAAGTRWRVTPVAAVATARDHGLVRRPRWSVELVRRKGGHVAPGPAAGVIAARGAELVTAAEMFCHEDARPDIGGPAAWMYEWNPDAGVAQIERDETPRPRGRLSLGFPADVAGRPASATVA